MLSIIDNPTPVVLVATKTDLIQQRRISERETCALANKYNCTTFEVSSAHNKEVKKCFHTTFKQIEARNQFIDDTVSFEAKILTAKRSSVHIEEKTRDSYTSSTYSTNDSD